VAHNDAVEGAQLVQLERAVALERQEAADVVGRRHGRVNVQVYRYGWGDLFVADSNFVLSGAFRANRGKKGDKERQCEETAHSEDEMAGLVQPGSGRVDVRAVNGLGLHKLGKESK
jgi:hypothetical protein